MTNRTVQRIAIIGVVLLAGLGSGACSWIPKGEAQFDVGIKDRGVASWYGEQFHGRQAANGQIYDMEALTAAHRTLPLGSLVRVVNLANGKDVHVRITDRGPYVNGRILDLSHAAAVALGMEKGGLSHVQVELVSERRLDALLSSDARRTLPSVMLLGSDAPAPRRESRYDHSTRLLPSDLWMQRRERRISSTMAAAYTAHNELVTLVLG